MPQGQAVRLQLRLQRWPERARRDSRGMRGTVDLQHSLQVLKVDADRAAITVTDVGLDAADHAGAAAERDRRGTGVAAPIQHRDELVLAPGKCHQVWCVRVVAAEGADQIAERPAVGVGGPLVRVRAECRLQRRRRRQPWRAQVQFFDPGRILRPYAVGAEAFGEGCPQLLQFVRCQPFALQAPAPELAPYGIH
jgi:hypothetical protein